MSTHLFGFSAKKRIRHAKDFQRAFQRRCSTAADDFVVYGVWNGLDHPRLGLSVSRKIGGAVVRNRWKRLLRETFRLTQSRLPPGVDLVVIPRVGREPCLRRLMESMPQLAARVVKKLSRNKA
jgi:ribonuclease P protein component